VREQPRDASGGSAPKRRVLIAGTRRSGEADYRLTVYGDPDSPFPPLRVRMSLRELGRWLREMQAAPEPSEAAGADGAGPDLRVVG
jgi:hypothetical protein